MTINPRATLLATLVSTLMAPMLLSAPAAAQEAAPGQAPEKDRPWTLSLTGGITAVQAQSDQPFVALGLARNFGDAFVKAELTYVGSGNARALTIPADTWIGTLSAGTYAGNLGLEGHVSLGTRRFDASSFRTQAGTPITVGRSGSLFGIGGSLSYDIAVADAVFVTPYVGVDYSKIDFAVALTGPNGRPVNSQQQSSDGVTGSAGVSISHVFANDGGSVALSGTFNTASNIAAVAQVGAGQRTAAGTPRLVDTLNVGGSWGELAGSVSFNASKAIAVDLSVIQTLSFPFGDTTAGIVGLRFRF